MSRSLSISSLAALPLLLLTGCAATTTTTAPRSGGGGLSVEQTSFPSKDAIAQIAAAPVPAKLSDDKSKDVPTWELTGPLPEAVERVSPQDDSAWGKLFLEAAAARGDAVVPTEAMRCVARESAAFYLANDARPAEMLERFIAARCGAPTSLVATGLQVITGDERIPDDKLFAQFHDRTKAMVDKTLAGGRMEAGLAYVRKGGRAVIAIAMTPQTVRLERTPLVPGPDGKVVIRGEVLGSAVALRALINRGRYGYGECVADPRVRLPRFAITCDATREDEIAWLSISALPPGRVLGSPVVEMLVWPSGTPGKAYAKLARGAAPSAGAAPEELVAEINRVRQEAKLPPLRLADQQTRTAVRLAPHYFSAMEGGGTDGVTDQVALGLLAGWEVDGMVRNGHFVSTWVTDASSWAEVVRAALSRPVGRETLLDPTAERVAVGPLSGDHVQGALFSTYALFDTYHHDNDPQTVATRIGNLRAGRGATPPRMVLDLNALAAKAAGTVQAGQRTPEEALKDLMQQVSERLGRNVRGWVAETTSLDRMTIPDELQVQPSLTIGIGVAHHRRQGSAWGNYVVMMVILDEGGGGGMTAQAGVPHAG